MYKKFLTTHSIFFHWQTLLALLSFTALRLLSFVLAHHSLTQAWLVFVIILIFGVLYFKNQTWAWYGLLGEILLGGAGHFLEFFGLSIRSMLLLTFLFLWLAHALLSKKINWLHIPHGLFYLLVALAGFVGLAMITGLANDHGLVPVIQDAAPYGFLLLILPTHQLFKKTEAQEFLVRLLAAFIIGSAILSLVTFMLFSSGSEILQGDYYRWFRDVAMGKITDLGNGFFRIVTPEHLLITPLILFISSLLMRQEKHHQLWRVMLILALLTLVLNFSRTYLLALVAGLLVLKYRHRWGRWARVGMGVVITSLLLFFSINLVASGGSGLNLLTNRVYSIARPSQELSGYTRLMLIPEIIKLIREKPILGSGFGAALNFYSPIAQTYVTTRQFDWGYLELWAELGLLGAVVFISLVGYILYELIKKIRTVSDYHDFYVGLLAGVVSLLVMNLSVPALGHVLGVFYLIFVIAVAMKPHTHLELIVPMLYRVFHRLRDSSQ